MFEDLPVVVGLFSGDMTRPDVIIICALTVAGFALGYVVGLREQRKAPTETH